MTERRFQIRPIADRDRPAVAKLLQESWHSTTIVSRGRAHDGSRQPGFIAERDGQLKGLVTYVLEPHQCEVLSLNSLEEGIGIGSALLEAVAGVARQAGCRRVWLTTTNDNLEAIRFYQRRGWRMAAAYPGSIAEARRIKPSIPLIGEHGIPIRDEIEFELSLTDP